MAVDSIDEVEELLRHDASTALNLSLVALEDLRADRESLEYQRWLSVKGSAQARLGETEDGARILREVRLWAETNDARALLALTHRRLSHLFRRVGDNTLALEHAVMSLDLLDDTTAPQVRADHLVGLADALGASGSFEESIERYREADELARASGDQHVQLTVLNNLAYTQYEAGLALECEATAELLRTEAEKGGQVPRIHIGDTIARAYLGVGRFEEAVTVLEPLCTDVEVSQQDCDGLALALITLTEVRRETGDFGAAWESLERASDLIAKYALTGREVEILHARAELFAAEGDYRRAYETLTEFHRADLDRRAADREAHVRTLNVIFGATEARRNVDHFRELSVRDPLTGLHNRRRLDDRLAELLHSAGREDAPLAIGLIDLDHFKRINDTRSHAVGDEVLRQVAVLLQSAAAEYADSLAVRMGGEEFLLLLPGVGPAAAAERFSALREAIERHPWDEVTAGIPVTVSIGVATAPGDAREREGLLETADKRLYEAKNGGRNRVVA